jgi:hypothetical protein
MSRDHEPRPSSAYGPPIVAALIGGAFVLMQVFLQKPPQSPHNGDITNIHVNASPPIAGLLQLGGTIFLCLLALGVIAKLLDALDLFDFFDLH